MYNAHLTLEERIIIEKGIYEGATKSGIAKIIGKDKSTIGKEIKQHRYLQHRCKLKLECQNYKGCPYGRKCSKDCPDFSQFTCNRRDHSPGACNGCSNWNMCRFNKYRYEAQIAQNDYERKLTSSREGANLTLEEAKEIAEIIRPLMKDCKQSPYIIINNHPELGISEKTLYTYIENGIFKDLANITVMDLKRKVSRRMDKAKTNQYKKRNDHAYLKGRKYNDYEIYIGDNPEAHVVQMDTVYNDVSNGPFIQTFKFIGSDIFLAFYHTSKTAKSMLDGVNKLEELLGKDLFKKYCELILTDRGPEFTLANEIELDNEGNRRCHIFYCDPMSSNQKGSLENNHIILRYYLPKEKDLYALGLTGQNKLNIIVSHMNSMPTEKLNGKSPFELAKFLYPDLYEKLIQFGLKEIERDAVVLSSSVLK